MTADFFAGVRPALSEAEGDVARQHRTQGTHGRSGLGRGRASRSVARVEPGRKSEGLIIPMVLGGHHH